MDNEKDVGIKIKNDVGKSRAELKTLIKQLSETNEILQKISSSTAFKEMQQDSKKARENIISTNDTLKKINSNLKAPNFTAWTRIMGNLTTKIINANKLSSGYIENLNLMQVAFKETRDLAEGFISSMADVFGLDESTMTRQLGFYKQIGNSLDIADDKAQLLSKNLLKIQLDMASLYNLDFERAGSVLQASLAGQTKPIRGATGADITQASLQIDATNYGIDRQVKNLSRAEKVILIYLSLQRQLAESNGDLSATINKIVANIRNYIRKKVSEHIQKWCENKFEINFIQEMVY